MTQHRRSHGQFKPAGQPRTPKQRRDYVEDPHQHILIPRRGYHGNWLVCSLPGCRYSERWDGVHYQPYYPPTPATLAESADEQAAHAIRPHNLWGDEKV